MSKKTKKQRKQERKKKAKAKAKKKTQQVRDNDIRITRNGFRDEGIQIDDFEHTRKKLKRSPIPPKIPPIDLAVEEQEIGKFIRVDTPDGRHDFLREDDETDTEFRTRILDGLREIREKYSDNTEITVHSDKPLHEDGAFSAAVDSQGNVFLPFDPDGKSDQPNEIDVEIDVDIETLDLTKEEKEIWKSSPAMVISSRVMAGDAKALQILADIQDAYDERKDEENQTLDHYHALLNQMYKASIGQADILGSPSHDHMRDQRLGWSLLKQARVFHLSRNIFHEVYRSCDIYTTELAGLKYIPPKNVGTQILYDMAESSEDDGKKLAKVLIENSGDAPYPEQFPFDVIFIGFGSGIQLMKYQLEAKILPMNFVIPDNIVGAALVGGLLTSTGYVMEYARVAIDDGRYGYIQNSLRGPESKWVATVDLAPWYLSKLVEFITSNRTFIVEEDIDPARKKKIKQAYRRGAKSKTKALWIPPPYYRLKLKDKLIQERAEDLFENPTGRKVSYRHDVTGHERYYVRRGWLPLDPKKEKALLSRGYAIYKHTRPSPEHSDGMLHRGIPPKLGNEWIAIKIRWIDSHISPKNKELPYIPALRTSGEKKHGQKES